MSLAFLVAKSSLKSMKKKPIATWICKHLISVYRNAGFTPIALDDVGAGHFPAWTYCRPYPDIVKIDRSVIMQIHQNYYKQEVLHSIAALCQKIGAVTIAEGFRGNGW